MSATCAVCLDDKALDRAIHCCKCESLIHPKCAQEHLLHTALEPHCPGCRQEWSHEFLADHLHRDWRLGIFKTHRENILLDREKSLIPDTQEAAFTELRTRKCKVIRADTVREIRKLKQDVICADGEISSLKSFYGRGFTKKQDVIELRNKKSLLQEKIVSLGIKRTWIDQHEFDPDTNTRSVSVTPPREDVRRKIEFIRPCPAVDCRGFLTTDWRCKICSSQTCSKCGELQADEAHVCNKDISASFQLIKKESKPCPKCGVPIHRISGCNHMFCTDCKTSFDWRTMEIHPDGNSNPHYWQWRATQPGLRIPSTDHIPGCANLSELIARSTRQFNTMFCTRRLTDLPQALSHLSRMTLPDIRIQVNSTALQQLRIHFILHDISEDEWKVRIQRVDKKIRKARFVMNILELFVQGAIDILSSYNPITSRNIDGLEQQIDNLRRLCNVEFDRSLVIFGTDSNILHEDFNFNLRENTAEVRIPMYHALKSPVPGYTIRDQSE